MSHESAAVSPRHCRYAQLFLGLSFTPAAPRPPQTARPLLSGLMVGPRPRSFACCASVLFCLCPSKGSLRHHWLRRWGISPPSPFLAVSSARSQLLAPPASSCLHPLIFPGFSPWLAAC